MLDLETAISLMKKYGYSSTSVHPYVYKAGDAIGICYSFIDEEFGSLIRVAIFRTADEMDDFLKKMQWFKVNGKEHNVLMKLDDYESPSPNIIYVRNGHMMASDEMFNLEKYDNLERQKKELNEVERYILEAANLMDYYNARKDEQLKFAAHIDELLKEHKKTYFDLQLLIDKYNDTSHDRKIGNLETKDTGAGINISLERATKERLSQYKGNPPEKAEAINFIKEVWNLCNQLETNRLYHANKVYEQQLINDTKRGVKKIEFMNGLLEKNSMFTKNLESSFAKIDRELALEERVLNQEYVDRKISDLNQKYSYYDKLDVLQVNNYLRESLSSNNYAELAIKYAAVTGPKEDDVVLDYTKTVEALKEKFKSISIVEQNSLILYFSEFGKLLKQIVKVNNYSTIDKASLISELKKNSSFDDLKTKFYDNVKISVELSTNSAYKKSLFANYDFTSFETFLDSCIATINVIKKTKGLELASEIDTFYITKDYDHISSLDIIDTSSNVSNINGIVKEGEKAVLGTIKKGSSVLYSPRVIDFEDFSSTASYSIKERSELTISFAKEGMRHTNKEQPIVVSKYNSNTVKEGNISIVDKLLLTVKSSIYVTELDNKEVK